MNANLSPQDYLTKSKTVLGEGPLDAKIWIIGEAPGEQEVYERRQFVGSSGKMLRQKLEGIGIDTSTLRFECLSTIRPPNNDLLFFKETKEGQDFMAESVFKLKERIKAGKPNIVILLGAGPLEYLLGYKNVGDWRGYVVWSEELGVKLLPTYHPTACIRQRYIKKKKIDENTSEFPGQFDALFSADLQKAIRNSFSPELNFPQVKVITNPTFQQVVDEYEYLKANAKILSYDIETMGTSLCDCISFACTTDRTISIPFYVTCGSSVYPYWKPGELEQIFRMVWELLESDIPKVAQNSKYDTVFLDRAYGIKVRNIVWDTMVASHNLYCELPKDLGTLISLYTDLPYHKHMMKADRWVYNAYDASSTLAVMEGQIKEFKDYGTLNHYRNVTNFALRPLTEMQVRGINIDLKVRNLAIQREASVMEDIHTSLDMIFPFKVNKDTKKFRGHKFNPGSVDAKKWLFYEKFGLKKRFNKGKETVDEDTVAEWVDHPKEFIALLAQAVIKFQHAKTMRAKMETPLDNGRMHSNFDVIGTSTGRLASKTTFWDSGTNLQNLKAGVQRQMLIPDPGEEFAMVDLWAAEAYVTALEAEEENLLKLLASGYKIHSWLYDNTFKKFPDECAKVGFEKPKYAYKYFKQLIHSMNYGSEVQNMARESGLPLAVCEWIYKFYHGTFPRIKVRQINIQERLQKTRTLTSLLGRQMVFLAPYSKDLLNDGYAWPSQSVIGEITIIAMSKLFYSGVVADFIGMPWTFPALNTHDGIAIRCRKGNREGVKKIVKDNFAIPLGKQKITVPVEIGWGDNANDIVDKEVLR